MKSGAVTFYDEDCEKTVYRAGEGFLDQGSFPEPEQAGDIGHPERQLQGPREADGRDSFLKLIQAYHERDYTVRVPGVVELSPPATLTSKQIGFATETLARVVREVMEGS